jgi:hypothetical protein
VLIRDIANLERQLTLSQLTDAGSGAVGSGQIAIARKSVELEAVLQRIAASTFPTMPTRTATCWCATEWRRPISNSA